MVTLFRGENAMTGDVYNRRDALRFAAGSLFVVSLSGRTSGAEGPRTRSDQEIDIEIRNNTSSKGSVLVSLTESENGQKAFSESIPLVGYLHSDNQAKESSEKLEDTRVGIGGLADLPSGEYELTISFKDQSETKDLHIGENGLHQGLYISVNLRENRGILIDKVYNCE